MGLVTKTNKETKSGLRKPTHYLYLFIVLFIFIHLATETGLFFKNVPQVIMLLFHDLYCDTDLD